MGDVDTLKEQIKALSEKIELLESSLKNKEITSSTHDEISGKQKIENNHSPSDGDIAKLYHKFSIFEQNQKDLIKQALAEFTAQKSDSLKSEFIRKFNKNKKSLIKQKIIDSLKVKPTNVADLKYYIVDQLKYCSKASFYRYIQEMKDIVEIKEDIAHLSKEVLV